MPRSGEGDLWLNYDNDPKITLQGVAQSPKFGKGILVPQKDLGKWPKVAESQVSGLCCSNWVCNYFSINLEKWLGSLPQTQRIGISEYHGKHEALHIISLLRCWQVCSVANFDIFWYDIRTKLTFALTPRHEPPKSIATFSRWNLLWSQSPAKDSPFGNVEGSQ